MGEESDSSAPGLTIWTANSSPYDSFMRVLNDLLLDLDDTYRAHREIRLEYYNFEPRMVMQRLVERALSTNTSPKEFFKDIQCLISLRAGSKIKSSVDVESDKRDEKLSKLEAKYNLRSGNEPDCISFSRLCYMFPHFAVMRKMKLLDKTDIFPKGKWSKLDLIPLPFFFPEFGGLIPVGQILKPEVKEAIVTVHLLALRAPDLEETSYFPKRLLQVYSQKPISLYAHHILLKQRIKSSLLTDELRLYYLLQNRILDSDSKLSAEVQEALDSLREDGLLEEVYFNMLK